MHSFIDSIHSRCCCLSCRHRPRILSNIWKDHKEAALLCEITGSLHRSYLLLHIHRSDGVLRFGCSVQSCSQGQTYGNLRRGDILLVRGNKHCMVWALRSRCCRKGCRNRGWRILAWRILAACHLGICDRERCWLDWLGKQRIEWPRIETQRLGCEEIKKKILKTLLITLLHLLIFCLKNHLLVII